MPGLLEHQLTGIRGRWIIRVAMRKGTSPLFFQGRDHKSRELHVGGSERSVYLDLTPPPSFPVPEGDVIVRWPRATDAVLSQPNPTLSSRLCPPTLIPVQLTRRSGSVET